MLTKNLEKKSSRILHANHRRVQHEGNFYFIRSQRLGLVTLADAELIGANGPTINLFARTKLAQELRSKVEMGLYS
jgi:hypothetical protein